MCYNEVSGSCLRFKIKDLNTPALASLSGKENPKSSGKVKRGLNSYILRLNISMKELRVVLVWASLLMKSCQTSSLGRVFPRLIKSLMYKVSE